jgi:hypothetical protein
MLSLRVFDMANRVYSSVKEPLKAEDYMPPVEGFDKGNIKQTVVSHSLWELLDSATVKLTDADSYAENQIVI